MQPELFDHHNLASIAYEDEQYILCHNPYHRQEDAKIRGKLLHKTDTKLSAIQKMLQLDG